MKRFTRIACAALGALLLVACGSREPSTRGGPPTLRLLTESQYRNVIADVFGEHIEVAARFDPIVRVEGLLAIGAGRVIVGCNKPRRSIAAPLKRKLHDQPIINHG